MGHNSMGHNSMGRNSMGHDHIAMAMDFDYHCEQVACTHARALTHSRAHAYVTHKRAGGGAVPRQVLAAGPA